MGRKLIVVGLYASTDQKSQGILGHDTVNKSTMYQCYPEAARHDTANKVACVPELLKSCKAFWGPTQKPQGILGHGTANKVGHAPAPPRSHKVFWGPTQTLQGIGCDTAAMADEVGPSNKKNWEALV